MDKNKKFININGKDISFDNERNVLEVIRKTGIELPTFCYHSELSVYGACRLCIVDIGNGNIQASCSIKPEQGMKIKTQTEEVRNIRKVNLELLLANHDVSCPTCARSNNCKLQDLSSRLGVKDSRFKKPEKLMPIDDKSRSIIHDPNKCVLCGDCVRVCKEIQTVGAIDFNNRGAASAVGAAFGKDLAEVECVYCGQCVSACPVGSLTPKPETNQVWKDIHDEKKTVVAQIAPAVRVALGEEFGIEPGTNVIGKAVASLKAMGFDYVFDTSFAADLTIIEEATEFINRKVNGGVLPQFTSCCPAWVKFSEQYYPELIPNLSSCKSPQQMFGSTAKEILPKTLGIKKEDLVVVSIMPCTAKKFEAKRPEFIHDDIADVDHVLTTEGLAKMIAETGIQFNKLAPQSFDLPLGFKTGAGVIFGNSGGVSEAVLRFAYEKITGKPIRDFEFNEVRGPEGIREVNVELGDVKLKLAVVHSLKNAREISRKVKNGEADYDLIEVMACPGGCINGGGQPVNFDSDYKEKRTQGIYNCDTMLQLHKPQENPYVKELYFNHLGEVGGEKAHHLLHTKYSGRRKIARESLKLRDSELSKIEVCVCVGTNCFRKGSQELLTQILDYVTENRLHDIVDVKCKEEIVDVKATFCFERCDRGPVLRINNKIIEHATFEKGKHELIEEIKHCFSLEGK